MTHTIPHILAALLTALGVTACDTEPASKVPSNAGTYAAPATFAQSRTPITPQSDAGSVAAWVNDTEIMEADVQNELARLRRQTFEQERSEWSLAEQRGWRDRVVRELVDRSLLDAWLADRKDALSDEDVDALLSGQIRERFGGEVTFEAHLRERGLTRASYREQLARNAALHRAFARKEDERAEALADLYAEVTNRDAHVQEARLTSVVIPSDHDVGDVPQTYEEVAALARRAARTPSELGWVAWSSLDRQLQEQLSRSGPETLIVVEAAAGKQLFWVHEIRERPTEHFERIEPILERRLDAIRFIRARDAKLRELRENASIRTEEKSTEDSR